MKKSSILAIDIGTTACKAVVIDDSCNTVWQAQQEYSLMTPKTGWSEQDPAVWWQAIQNIIRELGNHLNLHTIVGIGLCGQMHGLVALDDNMSVLRPAILWNDQRSALHCEAAYHAVGGKEQYILYTNNALLPGYVGGKLLWMMEKEPEISHRVRKICLPKDYIRYLLCGNFGTDYSDASGTGLFNVFTKEWPVELLNTLNIPSEWLPEAHPATETAGRLNAKTARALGLPSGIPVAFGGGDAVVQTIGCGTITEDRLLIVIGTGGNVTISVPKLVVNRTGAFQSFCHVIPDAWTSMGVTLTAGDSLKWFCNIFSSAEISLKNDAHISPYDLLTEEAARSPVGSKGVQFFPYLRGERCPHIDTEVRGAFTGLGIETDRSDMIRSILEGVALSQKDVYKYISGNQQQLSELCISGGGAASSLWRQIFADIFSVPVIIPQETQNAGAIGAGIIAGLSIGLWDSFQDAVTPLIGKRECTPNKNNAKIYSELFNKFKKGYPALKTLS